MNSCNCLIDKPLAFLASGRGSKVLPFNVSDRPSIVFLAPYPIIPDSPKHDHEEDQGGPIEVLSIGVGRDGEEHENEQRGLEREGAEVGSRSQSSARWYRRRESRQLTLDCRTCRNVCPS